MLVCGAHFLIVNIASCNLAGAVDFTISESDAWVVAFHRDGLHFLHVKVRVLHLNIACHCYICACIFLQPFSFVIAQMLGITFADSVTQPLLYELFLVHIYFNISLTVRREALVQSKNYSDTSDVSHVRDSVVLRSLPLCWKIWVEHFLKLEWKTSLNNVDGMKNEPICASISTQG